MSDAPTMDRLGRLHSITGIVPLAIFVAFHSWQLVAAVEGRAVFSQRIDGGRVGLTIETLLVIVPLLIHAVLGVLRTRRGLSERGSHDTLGARRLQAGSGAVLLAFLVLHVIHTWVPQWSGMPGVLIYDHLRDRLGQPAFLAIYLVGVTAIAIHLGQGIVAAVRTFNLTSNRTVLRWIRIGAAIAVAAMWLTAVNVVSHFSAGRALFGSAPIEQTQ